MMTIDSEARQAANETVANEPICMMCGKVDESSLWMSENSRRSAYSPSIGYVDVLWTYCKRCNMWTEHLPAEMRAVEAMAAEKEGDGGDK